jgi:hypothetical protein
MRTLRHKHGTRWEDRLTLAVCVTLESERSVALTPHEAAYSESLRIFFRARLRAKACFTRRFSPGFR